ncbi:MAG: Ig-like domain repeat protein [Acidimicrobiales bacterium]
MDGNALDSVSCASSTFCVAVDAGGNALVYNGARWTLPTSIDPGNALDSVSCASSTFCVAVDDAGNALVYNGATWTLPTSIDPYVFSVSVSCASSSFCAAVDSSGNALTYDGSAWTAPVSVASYALNMSVSCASSSFCAAVSGSGDALTYDGSAWTAPASVDGNGGSLNSVSCASSDFCVAVDGSGNALTFDGTTWSLPTPIDETGLAFGLSSVSCASSSFCAAVESSGNALTYDGSAWTAPVSVNENGGLSSVSCVSPTFCAAVDGSGNAFSYRVPPPSEAVLTLAKTRVSYGDEESDHLRVRVSSPTGTPSGTVTIKVGTTAVCTAGLSDGTASCVLSRSRFGIGVAALQAFYPGSASFAASSSAIETLTVMKEPSKTTLSVSKDRVAYGAEKSEHLVVQVVRRYSGTAVGRVSISTGRTRLCLVPLRSGHGSCTLSNDELHIGTHKLIAAYTGSTTVAASRSVGRRVSVLR